MVFNNEQLQRQLLAEPDLTFAKAMEISRTFETTTEEARVLQHDASSVESQAVNLLSNTNTADTTIRQTANRMPTNPCYRCGEAHQAVNADLSKQHVINVRRAISRRSARAARLD